LALPIGSLVTFAALAGALGGRRLGASGATGE